MPSKPNYKQYIEKVIAKQLAEVGRKSDQPTLAFYDLLQRGGKRLRGSLVLHAHEALGGKQKDAALQSALAIEMLHTYLLIIDDIQDNSDTRRGHSSVHVGLAQNDNKHLGVALALNAALTGAHQAQIIVANIDAPEQHRLELLKLLNKSMIRTARGQTSDLENHTNLDVSDTQIKQTMQLKTAAYSFELPLQIGIVLAGKKPADFKFVQDFAKHAGLAFQLANDIVGVFDEADSSDLTEGKTTLLLNAALKLASENDRQYLKKYIGKHTATTTQLNKCRQIFRSCGSLEQSQKLLKSEVVAAKNVLEQSSWPKQHQGFLNRLLEDILNSVKSVPL